MKKQTALTITLIIAIAGMLFSGYLSYTEIFTESCVLGGGCAEIAGIPVCVYGFTMYLTVFIISILGLKGKK